MEPICIITDNTAQFPHPNYPGRNLVNIISLRCHLGQNSDVKRWNTQSLPPSASEDLSPRLVAPSMEEFRQLLSELGNSYRKILGIFLSAKLSNCFQNAEIAAQSLQNGCEIQIIDSQTTSAGLGLMVQTAAQAIAEGASLAEAEQKVRQLIPQSYAIICIPNLSYLYFNGLIDHTQALVGEMLGILPVFNLEEGSLSPAEKLRSPRQISEFFQEFLDEFDELQHVALLQPANATTPDINLIKEYAQRSFSSIAFSAHPISLPLATLFGPTCTALFVLERGSLTLERIPNTP